MVEKKRKELCKAHGNSLDPGRDPGYTKIATVITADLPVISSAGQATPPASSQSLSPSTPAVAGDAGAPQRSGPETERPAAQPQAQPQAGRPGLSRRYRITVNGKVYETSIQMVSQ